MSSFELVKKWVSEDEFRLKCLKVAELSVGYEWYLSAGFVRNLVWDRLQRHSKNTPLNDVDLIYFDPTDVSIAHEIEIEERLINAMSTCNWSVKNQARMSLKHGHESYKGCVDAMSYWPEIQTAVGVTVSKEGILNVESPFSASEVVRLAATRNPKCTTSVFQSRVSKKGWSKSWPELEIET